MRLLLQESEVLRVTAFEIYWLILTKVKRRIMIFPLRHQVLSLMVLMVLHLVDENVCVVQVRLPLAGPPVLLGEPVLLVGCQHSGWAVQGLGHAVLGGWQKKLRRTGWAPASLWFLEQVMEMEP